MEIPLAYYGEPILRKKALPVEEINDEIKKLVADMIDTMHANDGVGLAATQVFADARVFITYVPKEDSDGNYIPGTVKVYINPQILEISEELSILNEGCLSIPGVKADVARPLNVKIKAIDLDGKEFVEEVTGYEAHAVLHENDHINGVLYIDRIDRKERRILEARLHQIKKKYSKKR